jgi:DNA modification methylase
MTQSEMKIQFTAYDEIRNLDGLKPSPYQRNTHPGEQIDRLAKIMRVSGVRHPIHLSKRTGTICYGHGRKEAALKNGWKTYPVVYQDFEDDAAEYASVQSDNAIAFWSELDLSGINSDLGNLGPDFDLDLLGIKDFVLEPADKLDPQCDEDEVPEHVEPKTKLGDIYQLGRHRLMCGDSTSIDAVEKLMNGEKADLWLTDPPYGVDIKQVSIERYQRTGRGSTQSSKQEISNDIASKDGWKEILGSCFTNAFIACSDKSSHYVFTCQGSDKQMMMMMMQEAGWNFRHELIWKKNRFILGRSDYHYQHEPILYGWKESGTHEFEGGRDKSSVIETPVYKNDLHPTMKPIELLEQLVENSSKQNGRVLDTFGGSGSTLIACEKTNRNCFMMELDPHYCDVIISRWERYTGKKAELVGQ